MTLAFSHQLEFGRFETRTKKPDFDFLQVNQVHGTDIVSMETLPSDADGIMASWNQFEIPLVIKTADCLPIVIEGTQGVIFLHAGWKGLAAGILKRPEVVMIVPKRFFIGPSIQQCCFEVSPDFNQNFPESSNFKQVGDKVFFNLQAEAQKQIASSFPAALIETAHDCTCCDPKFHSYRRDKTTQRNFNIFLKG